MSDAYSLVRAGGVLATSVVASWVMCRVGPVGIKTHRETRAGHKFFSLANTEDVKVKNRCGKHGVCVPHGNGVSQML